MKSDAWQKSIVGFGIIAYTLFFSWFTIARSHNFNAGWYDLGIMTQTVWRVGHGLGFTFTNPEGGPGGVHGWESLRTAIHTDYLLIGLAPLSWTGWTAESLLIIQALIIALGAWFVFRLTKTVLHSAWLGVFFAWAYLFYPPLHFANLFEFHAVTLAITFILGAVDAIVHKRRRAFWIWAALALLTKEQVGISFGILSAIVWWWKGERRMAWMALSMCWAWALIQFLVVIPFSRPDLPGSFTFTKFYASAGEDAGAIADSLGRPQEIWSRLATRTHVHDLVQLTPLGIATPVLGVIGIVAVPEMFPYWISDSPNQQTLFLHYHALAIPYLFLSAIAGWRLLQKLGERWGKVRWVNLGLAVAMLWGSAQATWQWSIWPWSPITRWPLVAWEEKQRPEVLAALTLVPPRASTAFTQNLGPYLAERPVAQLLPNGILEVEYVVILERQFDPNIPTNDKRLVERTMLEMVKDWAAQQPTAFETIYQQGRVLVIHRIGEPNLPEPVWPAGLLGR